MREIIIIGGPNGAGKTSFANEYFPYAKEGLFFVNADEIARDMPPELSPVHRDLRAGREMLARIDQLVADGIEFMFETTLAVAAKRISCLLNISPPAKRRCGDRAC